MEGETRPTFDQVFSAESATAVAEPSAAASPAATPASETPPADSASAATTEPPAATDPAAAVEPASTEGPIPLDRHKAILENARQKARDEALAEWRKEHGWAEQVSREQLAELVGWYQRASADPVAFTLQMLDDLRSNPQFAPQLTSHAARILAASRGAAVEPDIEPDIPVVDDQGRVVSQAFSAERVKQLVAREVQKAVSPLQETQKQREQREAEDAKAREQEAYVVKETERIGATLNGLPKYAEHKDAVQARIREIAQQDRASMPGEIALKAYVDVVFAKLTDKAQSEVLATLQTKAAAAALNPATAAQSAPKRPKDFYEAFGVER